MNGRKTHCKRGHDLTDPENSYGYKGRRQCKTCARMRARGELGDREATLAAKREAYRRNKAKKESHYAVP